jgi:poly(ADP-ribose) glycohydrolase
LSNVDVLVGKIEDRYQWDIMIDFANKNVGGGVLGRGAVQEEILFLCFPELVVGRLMCA